MCLVSSAHSCFTLAIARLRSSISLNVAELVFVTSPKCWAGFADVLSSACWSAGGGCTKLSWFGGGTGVCTKIGFLRAVPRAGARVCDMVLKIGKIAPVLGLGDA